MQAYKKAYKEKHGVNKSAYSGQKTSKNGLKRWFDEKWINQRGEIGYKFKSDVYRPSIRITRKTPVTYDELTKKELQKARNEKYRTGHVKKFKFQK